MTGHIDEGCDSFSSFIAEFQIGDDFIAGLIQSIAVAVEAFDFTLPNNDVGKWNKLL